MTIEEFDKNMKQLGFHALTKNEHGGLWNKYIDKDNDFLVTINKPNHPAFAPVIPLIHQLFAETELTE